MSIFIDWNTLIYDVYVTLFALSIISISKEKKTHQIIEEKQNQEREPNKKETLPLLVTLLVALKLLKKQESPASLASHGGQAAVNFL
jgi:hypothetical protein